MILSGSGENGHPCLVLDLREKAFPFLLSSMMLAVSFPYYYVEEMSL